MPGKRFGTLLTLLKIMAKKQHSTLRLKTYYNVYTDKKRVLQIAIMDQYGRIFETFTNERGETDHRPTGECGSANH